MSIRPSWFWKWSLGLAMLALLTALLAAEATPSVEAARRPTPTPTPTPAVPPPHSVPGSWKTVASPNAGANSNILYGVAAIAADDIWAVGTADYRSLTMRWNGQRWSIVPSPNLPAPFTTLRAVAGSGSNDVWAVGDDSGGNGVIMRWNGVAWSIVPSPNPAGNFTSLRGVTALSPTEAWAVGESGYRPFILRWNGVAWSQVAAPNPSTRPYHYLYGVTALASNDVWAVGSYAPSGSGPLSFTLRWDGASWRQVSSPNQAGPLGQTVYNRLHAVSGSSPTNVWAVGTAGNLNLAMRWNGSQWQLTPTPNMSGRENFLTGVAALAANDVWAVGYAQRVFFTGGDGGVSYAPDTLILHWNCTGWAIIPSPSPVAGNSRLFAVDAVANDDIWAVGGAGSGTLTERYTAP